jgi:hypothetical protein
MNLRVMLAVGFPMLKGSKLIGQTKRDILVLQIWLGHETQNFIPVKNINH